MSFFVGLLIGVAVTASVILGWLLQSETEIQARVAFARAAGRQEGYNACHRQMMAQSYMHRGNCIDIEAEVTIQ